MEDNNIDEDDEGVLGNDIIGQQGRQPSISDPKLWLIKCRMGKERESVTSLYHKFFHFNSSDNKMK